VRRRRRGAVAHPTHVLSSVTDYTLSGSAIPRRTMSSQGAQKDIENADSKLKQLRKRKLQLEVWHVTLKIVLSVAAIAGAIHTFGLL